MPQRWGPVLARVKGSSPGLGNKELRVWQFQGQMRRGPMELARQLLLILPASPVGGGQHMKGGRFSNSARAWLGRRDTGEARLWGETAGSEHFQIHSSVCIASSPVAGCGHPVPTWLLTHTCGNDVSFVPGDNQCL